MNFNSMPVQCARFKTPITSKFSQEPKHPTFIGPKPKRHQDRSQGRGEFIYDQNFEFTKKSLKTHVMKQELLLPRKPLFKEEADPLNRMPDGYDEKKIRNGLQHLSTYKNENKSISFDK